MNNTEKALSRIKFQLKIYSSDGTAFETLFKSIMQYSNPNFTPVKPQGNIGDRKNDGYIKTIASYYQVFAPEESSKTLNKTIKKIYTDFKGLKDYWDKVSPIKEYHFVLNDKYKGSNPTIETELSKIKIAYNLNCCNVFLSKDLEDVCFTLPDDKIIVIIGDIPNPSDIQLLDYSILNDVINNLLKYKKKVTPLQLLSVPNFDEKIIFNGLSNNIATLLKNASFHLGTLENYFEKNSNFVRQELRDIFNQLYLDAKTKYSNSFAYSMNANDLVFFDILESCTPKGSEFAQDSALVLMAYFFESCDIFDDPILI
jgi:hypothetical protein